jgi:thiosulfate dehydrogenase
MKRFLTGLVIGILMVPAGGYLYLRRGYAPAAASDPPLPLEKIIASMALRAHIAKEAPAKADIPLTEDALMAGAKIYREYCAACHGIGSEPKSPAAIGMYPPPPQLFHGQGVADDPVGETYWKVANGIRLTGMPSYRGALMETQLWQVSLLLAHADKLPPAVSAYLANPAPGK